MKNMLRVVIRIGLVVLQKLRALHRDWFNIILIWIKSAHKKECLQASFTLFQLKVAR